MSIAPSEHGARRVPVWAGMLAVLLGIIGYFALGIWLMEEVAWVESCRPAGRNLAYMVSALSCSPGLLEQGAAGLGLFAWLWAMPLAIIAGIVLPALKRRRAPSSAEHSAPPQTGG